jgi:hypothetical protein
MIVNGYKFINPCDFILSHHNSTLFLNMRYMRWTFPHLAGTVKRFVLS